MSIKRSFDFLIALMGIILLSPVFLIIVLLIEIEEPGTSFVYSQTRIGKDGVPFKMYKFRSMRQNADQLVEQLRKENNISDVTFKMKDDPRVTRIGKFIRKHSLDELLQLFNVLIGNMSLVGPRPGLPEEVAKYSDKDMVRLSVLPGCTGVWQVSGRNGVTFKEMIKMDTFYVTHQTFVLDFQIIMKTAKVVIFPNEAY